MAQPSPAHEPARWQIRHARPEDLPAVIEIYNAAIVTRMATAQLETVTVESRKNWINDHKPDEHPFFILEAEGRVAGWLTFKSFLPRCAYRGTAELSVYVHPNYRRRGIARALLEQAIAVSPQLEVTALVGLIFAQNEPSIRLFEQLGFSRWGYLPGIARFEETS